MATQLRPLGQIEARPVDGYGRDALPDGGRRRARTVQSVGGRSDVAGSADHLYRVGRREVEVVVEELGQSIGERADLRADADRDQSSPSLRYPELCGIHEVIPVDVSERRRQVEQIGEASI